MSVRLYAALAVVAVASTFPLGACGREASSSDRAACRAAGRLEAARREEGGRSPRALEAARSLQEVGGAVSDGSFAEAIRAVAATVLAHRPPPQEAVDDVARFCAGIGVEI